MKKETIRIPQGMRYLGQWKDFDGLLPDCHFILNKALTGVGATQHFLTNDTPVVLASPRCSLMESKRQKHPDVWFYRDMSDNACMDGNIKKSSKKATYEDIRRFNEETARYVADCYNNHRTPKVMVTYDSLGHVIEALKSVGSGSLDSWALVIDEFQAIFTDSAFKSLTEMKLLEDAGYFRKAIFLSATPYLEDYMEQLDEFKNMPYIELLWPEDMREEAVVTNITLRKDESRCSVCGKIIRNMKEGRTVKFGTKEIDTTEAVFYMNNVSDICRIIRKCGLAQDEVNILCSKSNGDKLGKYGLQPGSYPKEGERHKPFTFCTRTAYLGVDFYSTCAYSYIFADPSQKTLALDISTDLPQILGRQRLETNPYRNEAILFIKENSLGLDDKDFSKYIKEKEKRTNDLINCYGRMTREEQNLNLPKYRSSMERDRYRDDYLMVVDDRKSGNPSVKFNTLYMLAEIRAWQIRKKNYSSQYSVAREQRQAGIMPVSGTKSTNPDVLSFEADFEGTGITDRKIKVYCDFRNMHPDLVGELDFVPNKYAGYWDALGYDNLKSLGFQESRIKSALSEPTPFDDRTVIEVRNALEERRYTPKELKSVLGKVYDGTGRKRKASANDAAEYVTVMNYQDSRTGKRYIDVKSLYQKDITFFPFTWLPNSPGKMTIDRFLGMVRTGSYKIRKSGKETSLKDAISEIRGIDDGELQDSMKKDLLPVVCVNGCFKYRSDNWIEKYSSFTALDYDGFDDRESMTEAKEKLKSYPFVYSVFETPSGKGLKAIVLHDSVNPENHWNLYLQLMEICRLPQIDDGVMDLSRCQYLSYDPDIWVNPEPVAFHFKFDNTLVKPETKNDKFVAVQDDGDARLDDYTSNFLERLGKMVLTDDAVMERLDKHWKKERPEYFEKGNRHNSMLVIAGTLCKAGIRKDKALEYLEDTYCEMPEKEIGSIVDYSYSHNTFGSDRRFYRSSI